MGILVREDLVMDLIQVGRINLRIMKIKIVMGKKVGNIFSVYAPQVDRPEAEKEAFWGMLDDVTTVAESEVIKMLTCSNGYIGEDRRGFEEL